MLGLHEFELTNPYITPVSTIRGVMSTPNNITCIHLLHPSHASGSTGFLFARTRHEPVCADAAYIHLQQFMSYDRHPACFARDQVSREKVDQDRRNVIVTSSGPGG